MSWTASREPTYEADTLRIIYPVTRSACRVVDLLCLVWTWAPWQGKMGRGGGGGLLCSRGGGGRAERGRRGGRACVWVCVRACVFHCLGASHNGGSTRLPCPPRGNVHARTPLPFKSTNQTPTPTHTHIHGFADMRVESQ